MNATFQELFEKYLVYKKPQIEEGSFESLKKLKDKITLYERHQKKPLLISEMNLDFFNRFVKGLSNGRYGKCTNGTIKLYCGIVNGFLGQCIIFGYSVNLDYLKFREYLKTIKLPKTDRPILLDDELAQVWNFKGFNNKAGKFIKVTRYKQKIKDLFVFQCQIGIRWGDIGRLRRKDLLVRNRKWYIVNFTTQKRKSNITVQLNQLALKVVFRYCPKLETMPQHQPIFRQVSDCSNATHTLKWIAKKCGLNRLVNTKKGKLKKVVSKRQPICDLVSTHSARRKFATEWMAKGKSIYKLQKILGHKSIRTTERYCEVIPDFIPEGIETELDEKTTALFQL